MPTILTRGFTHTGGTPVTRGYGGRFLEKVRREVMRLLSIIDKQLRINIKWKKSKHCD